MMPEGGETGVIINDKRATVEDKECLREAPRIFGQHLKHAKTAGEHDPLQNARRARPIITCNRFGIFQSDDDSDSESDADDSAQMMTDATTSNKHTCRPQDFTRQRRKHKPIKRQRQRHKGEICEHADTGRFERRCAMKDAFGTRGRCIDGDTAQEDNGDDIGRSNDSDKLQTCNTMSSFTIPPWRGRRPTDIISNPRPNSVGPLVRMIRNSEHDDDEAVRDAAVADLVHEENWIGIGSAIGNSHLPQRQRRPQPRRHTQRQQQCNECDDDDNATRDDDVVRQMV